MSSEFKKRDVVRLIPSGQLMVVFSHLDHGRVECIWFCGEGKLNKQAFWPDELAHMLHQDCRD